MTKAHRRVDEEALAAPQGVDDGGDPSVRLGRSEKLSRFYTLIVRPVFYALDLTTDHTRWPALNLVIWVSIFCLTATIFLPFLIQDPRSRRGPPVPGSVEIVVAPPEAVDFQVDLDPLPRYRVKNDVGIGVAGLALRLSVVDFTESRTGQRCSFAEDYQQTDDVVWRALVFCTHIRTDGCEAKTDSFGYVEFAGCSIAAGMPGIALLAPTYPDGTPLTCAGCVAGTQVRVGNSIMALQLAFAPVDPAAPQGNGPSPWLTRLSAAVGEPLPAVVVTVLDFAGRPVPRKTVIVHTYPLSPAAQTLVWDQREDKRALLDPAGITAVTGEDGTALFDRIIVRGSTTHDVVLFIVCEGVSYTYPLGGAGVHDFGVCVTCDCFFVFVMFLFLLCFCRRWVGVEVVFKKTHFNERKKRYGSTL
jgi:hypothetical protein